MEKSDHRDFYTGEAAGYESKRYGSRYGQLFRTLQRKSVDRALSQGARIATILDVASGTGQMLPSLASFGDLVVASDLTPAMLAVARERSSMYPNVLYCVADATRLPYAIQTFDAVASSRFLHLFAPSVQQELVQEMARVLSSGGTLVVDYYSANGRRIFAPFIWFYRTLLRKRPENDHRVSLRDARHMIERAGLEVVRIEGIGNFLLVPWLWLPRSWLLGIATWLGQHCVSWSEQFIVVARKP
ncbi:MAG: class I SAM-dependent methyltransferase [Tahibacter sp.]